jgi:hypothetical protein
MVDIQQQGQVFLYEREDIAKDQIDGDITCIWKVKKRIRQFPSSLVRQKNPKAIFSPSLDKFLDYDSIN